MRGAGLSEKIRSCLWDMLNLRCPVDIQVEMRHAQLDMSLELRGVVQVVDIKLIDIRGELVFKALSLSADQEIQGLSPGTLLLRRGGGTSKEERSVT